MGRWWSRFRRWRERGAAAPDVPPRVVSASRWNELVNREADLATVIQQTSHPDRRRFADRVAAGQQRRPTVVSLTNPQLQDGYTECLVLPLWVGQRSGGWIELYWGPPDLLSADPTGIQVLADLSQAIAALVIVPA